MGPKNYSFEYVDKDGQRKSTFKVKGLTLDYKTFQCLNGPSQRAEILKKLWTIRELENIKIDE